MGCPLAMGVASVGPIHRGTVRGKGAGRSGLARRPLWSIIHAHFSKGRPSSDRRTTEGAMWKTTLDRLLDRLVVEGTLEVAWADGSVSRYGRDSNALAPARMRVTDPRYYRTLCLNPVMAFGEGYMD